MKTLKSYMIAGAVFVSVLGTLLHFAYAWSAKNALVGLCTPVNESIWEHTKLLFFPMWIYSLFPNKKIMTEHPCVRSAMIIGELFGIVSIIVLYYTYSGVLGLHFAVADIAVFYISVILSFWVAYKRTLSCKGNKYKTFLSVCQAFIVFAFIFFTVCPPDLPLFTSP